MSLKATDYWSNGHLFNAAGVLLTTPVTTGATIWAGFLRDADGRLVVK